MKFDVVLAGVSDDKILPLEQIENMCYNEIAETVDLRGVLLLNEAPVIMQSTIENQLGKAPLVRGINVPVGCLSNTGESNKGRFVLWQFHENFKLVKLANI